MADSSSQQTWNGISWTWSGQHQDYYYVTSNANGQYQYHFYKQLYSQDQGQEKSDQFSGEWHERTDSGTYPDISSKGHGFGGSNLYYSPPSSAQSTAASSEEAPSMPDPIPYEERVRLPNLIPGTPEKGWYHPLDTGYRMRTGAEAHQFFKIGRVFSMLYSEAASESMARAGDDSVTVVKFGEHVFSQIRRFVVVSVKRNFVKACGISTYSGRGTLKPGCNPREHAPIYFVGSSPVWLVGEHERGMTKDPIAVEPADSSLTMPVSSRIRFGKTYPIEWNVKVKDIGRVVPEDLRKLITYWKEEDDDDWGGEMSTSSYTTSAYPVATSRTVAGSNQAGEGSVGRHSSTALLPQVSAGGLPKAPAKNEAKVTDQGNRVLSSPPTDVVMTETHPQYGRDLGDTDLPMLENADPSLHLSGTSADVVSRIIGELHSEYEIIEKPRTFFKKGRVFMVVWPEPGGEAVKDQLGPPVFMKARRFVVIRPKATHCVCLPINTYQGQATTKPGVVAQDHAAVVMLGEEPKLHPEEKQLTKEPMFITLENKSTGPIDPMSRINFAKVYTVEYNVKVRNIGRIVSDSIWRMDQYFAECFKLGAN
ncbi:hypothetical protein BU26DRAFT_276633 [Trematosphaeria pertusa]|uniref:DUF6590 domain-containing protein n=1 Tax=Trematosphaeria pertusa TaxID=390896 RepID=A0A6A6IKJ4_9PLEO|nr:uncharacterized protein BU26DRAFT_276633 [Trematosphaeria pertusa]KAF2251135.1 hypothetical protein BU26DRAFT_276633 [Trematosphaeria pertusa]